MCIYIEKIFVIVQVVICVNSDDGGHQISDGFRRWLKNTINALPSQAVIIYGAVAE